MLFRSSPLEGKHQFYFIHQRSNHVPYICDITDEIADRREVRGKPQAVLNITQPTRSQKRRHKNYKRGLLCYDKSLDELLSRLEKRPGALYIFMTADHNEMMGGDGLWGHANLPSSDGACANDIGH